ncbi:hypothetical protein Cha6605_2851 [Chamaesiphon minutus PCC 6605]|uniref:Uncharacterized protein n=1 Tax=Chamaesiphon minutus (strain ATCC 27169 / PCC 6605) TaxID=1173020 RepID=K9UFK8_CHAP6|nr:hypothetical protein Cha6605_2851 [Chamaesiphon minutus PCC 6605]
MVHHPFLAARFNSTLSLKNEISTRISTVEEIDEGVRVDCTTVG